ncbi:MAG: PilZ domain-containing protein [Candidatus Latescibacterota bacterium]
MHTAVMVATLPAVLAQGYLNTDSDLVFTGQMQWILLLVGLGIVGVIALKFITKTQTERAQKRKRSAVQGSKSQAFLDRAQHLGFRQNEARTVERIARRLAPKSPLNLLNSVQGREFLMGDLKKRIVQRGREIKVLGRIKQRLEALRASDVHEREWVRVDANIAVWVSKQGLTNQETAALVDDEDEAEGEGLFANLDSVSGRLLDISEGGAAIDIEMDVGRGDQVQFWSGDPRIVLGETRAGVVSIEKSDEGTTILHLHFIDPDLRGLRSAILQLKGEEEDD